MIIEINGQKVEAKYWESPDGSQKRYYLKAEGHGHNRAIFNLNTGEFEFPKKAFDAMNIEFARKIMEKVECG